MSINNGRGISPCHSYHCLKFKTPRRWAKRQINMRKSVTVTIERFENEVVVSNNKGKVWKFPFKYPADDDTTVNGVVADIASAMLTGTIASQLKEVNSPAITYTLMVETK